MCQQITNVYVEFETRKTLLNDEIQIDKAVSSDF